MSLFQWLLGKPDALKQDEPPDSGRSQRSYKSGSVPDESSPTTGKATPGPEDRLSERRVKRHARREQLYVAVRESMLRAGVLSASYKFKVLSLDQRGDQFLVMIDVAPGLGDQADKLTEIETLMINTAKSLFSIYVTSVYWRTDKRPATANAVNFGVSPPVGREAQPSEGGALGRTSQKSGAQRYEPIHDEEMAAFKRARAVSSGGAGKSRSGLRPLTLIAGLEDPEMPESPSSPALSATQYGELGNLNSRE